MLKLNEDEGKRPSFLDCSGLSCYRRCPARYAFRYVLGLDTPEPKPAMDYGTATHCAMPFLQRGDLAGGINAHHESWVASGNEPDEKRNDANAIKMLTLWFKERIQSGLRPYEVIEPPTTDTKMKETYSDQEFAFTLDLEAALPFSGRVDAAAREQQGKQLAVVEYKTTSQLGQTFLNSFQLSSQVIGYSVALSILMHESCSLAFLEALRVSSKNPANLCIPITIKPWMQDGFIANFQDTASLILRDFSRRAWIQDFSACAPYDQFGSHGYVCQYELLCNSSDLSSLSVSFWRQMAKAYVVNHWEPFLTETPK